MDNKNIFAKNLKKYMDLYDKSRRQICDELGFNYYTFSDWVNAKKYPRMDKVEQLAEYFGIKKSDLIEEANSTSLLEYSNLIPLPKVRNIPLIGEIACGDPILAEQNIADHVPVPEHIHGADFALTCKGDSMINARIFDGDIVYIHQQPEVENGQIAAVLIGSEATLKRVYKHADKLVLNPENPAYEPLVLSGAELEDVKIIGKAVAFISAVR